MDFCHSYSIIHSSENEPYACHEHVLSKIDIQAYRGDLYLVPTACCGHSHL